MCKVNVKMNIKHIIGRIQREIQVFNLEEKKGTVMVDRPFEPIETGR